MGIDPIGIHCIREEEERPIACKLLTAAGELVEFLHTGSITYPSVGLAEYDVDLHWLPIASHFRCANEGQATFGTFIIEQDL